MRREKRRHGVLWWFLLLATAALILIFASGVLDAAAPTELTTYPLGWPAEYADGEEYLVATVPLQLASYRGTVYRVAATVKDHLDPAETDGVAVFVLEADWGILYVADLCSYCREAGLDLFGDDPGVDYTAPAVGERGRFVVTYLGMLGGEAPFFVYGANAEFVAALREELDTRDNRGSIADVLASILTELDETMEPEPTPEPTPERDLEAETMEAVSVAKIIDPEIATPEPTPAPTKAPKTYICNTSSKVFHKPSCSSVSSMSDANKKTYEGQASDLIAAGYKACGRCNPH